MSNKAVTTRTAYRNLLSPLLVLSLCLLPHAAVGEVTNNNTNSATHVDRPTFKIRSGKQAIRNDWYTIEQLKRVAPERASTLSETVRRQTATCGGAFFEPSRFELGLDAPTDDSILGSAYSYEFEEGKLAKLVGNVILQQDSLQVESDEVEIDFTTDTAFMTNNIRFRDNQMLLLGESATLNLDSGEASFQNAEYTLHRQHIRGIAKTIDSTPPNQMTIYDGTYTGCQPGNQDWYFRGEKIDLNNASGWGTVHHMALFIQQVPVLYVPYFRFPIDDKRHSGFLYPSFDSLTEPDLSIPFYLNLAPNYDLTFTPRFIGDRGTLLQSEFRFLNEHLGEGQLNFDIMPEDKEFDNEVRKSARWQEKRSWNQHWSAKADINYLSDSDYLNDFGTDLSTISESHLIRELQFSYHKDSWFFSARMQSWQTIDENVADTDLPYRRLPELNLSYQKSYDLNQNLPWLRADWQQSAQMVYFEQPLSSNTLANPSYAGRLHYQSELALPMRWMWGFVRPATTFYATRYELAGLDDVLDSANEQQSRALASASIDSGLYFEKILTPSGQTEKSSDTRSSEHFSDSITQTLEPRLFFLYVPYEDQSLIPLLDSADLTFSMSQLFRSNRFSGYDRIGDTRQVSAAVTSRFINNSTGLEFGRASIGQIYYLADRRVQLVEGASDDLQRSSSNIVAETEIHWDQFWSSRATFEWDISDDQIEQGQIQLNYLVNERQLYHIGYRFRQANSLSEEEINQYDISLIHPYSDRWDLIAAWNFDLEKDQTLEQLTGLSYSSCCWRSSLIYRTLIEDTNTTTDETTTEYSLMLEFELIGLGQLGGRLQKLLRRTVFGYDQFTSV